MIDKIPTLKLIEELCLVLDQEEVVYCHWKSTAAIDRSATGENDLDLLVSRTDAQRIIEILSRLGFKEARAPQDKQLPGVLDFFGYDQEADSFVHVHLHFQLILGNDLFKNYRLPIEKPYLETALQSSLFRIPLPELEWITFIVRMVLKHSTWVSILLRQMDYSSSERNEREYLRSRMDPARVYEFLVQYLPCISRELFEACEQSLQPGCSLWSRVRTGQRLQRSLAAHTRNSSLSESLFILWRRYYFGIQRKIFKNYPKLRLSIGGAFIAVVGGDGSGKTTAIEGLLEWLALNFDVRKIHLGKPRPSVTTILVRGFLKIGKTLRLYPYMRAPIKYTQDRNAITFPGYPWLFREVCTARDRYLTYIKARRYANQGGLVISDRFPLPQVKYMDGPLAEMMTASPQGNWLIRKMIKLEEQYYASILLPELLLVLKVAPEIAVQRKVEDEASAVSARSGEIWEIDWEQTPAHVVDASQSKEQVLAEFKRTVWSSI